MLEFNGTIIVIVISFVVFMIMMQYVFYKPMIEMKDQRDSYVDTNRRLADNADDKSQGLIKEFNSKISNAKVKSNEIVSAEIKAANKERANILQEKQNVMQNKIEVAENKIEEEKNDSIENLKPQIVALAQEISSKILKEDVVIANVTPEIIERTLNNR